MKGSLRLIFADNLIKLSFISSVLLIILQTILISVFVGKLPPLIPFINSQPWGISRLYPSWATIFIPAMLIAVLIINSMLSATFYRNNTLAARILSFNSLLFIFLTLLSFIQIISLVF